MVVARRDLLIRFNFLHDVFVCAPPFFEKLGAENSNLGVCYMLSVSRCVCEKRSSRSLLF